MAGIGVKLNRIFEKRTLTASIFGFGYSTLITIAPMILVIGTILLMQWMFDFSSVGYAQRELFASTILYIFIFSLLTASPFNSVLSKYMSDVIYEERFEDILPCYNIGLFMNMVFSSIFGIPFCLHEYFVGGVAASYVFAGYCGYVALVLVFYSMLYLSICKDYKKISYFFLIGMLMAILCTYVCVETFNYTPTYAMLIGMDIGFVLIACLEGAVVRSYFRNNSGRYKAVLCYFKKYWQLIFTNFLYTLGMYIHNFVFWSTDKHMVVAKSFVSMTSYDMATCLAMFTNISASVIFISRVEMHFHERYKAYSEAVIGGRGADIELAKKRMFRQLGEELMNLARIQFIVSVVVFLICVVIPPQYGYGGNVMKIYPCLAAGYFILFTMYAGIIFLYYFSDLKGALYTVVVFCLGTFVFTVISSKLSTIWYGLGLVIGAFGGWTVAYFRLQWLEKNIDEHIFCVGNLIKYGSEKKPDSKVYDLRKQKKKEKKH